MNVYFVDAGVVQYKCCEVGGQGHYEDERLVAIVVAKTRGQARYFVWQENNDTLGDLNETQWVSTKIVKRDVFLGIGGVPTQPGVIGDSSSLWG